MWTEQTIRELLARVARGEQTVDAAFASLRSLPYEDAGDFAKLDHHRSLRHGFPEVIFCSGKTVSHVAEIFQRLAAHHPRVLGTRATIEQFEATRKLVPDARYNELARALYLDREPDRGRKDGIVIVAAGTSDLPVAEECAVTLDLMGHSAQRTYDVGVAGLHRLLTHIPVIQAARVVIVIAGM